MKSANQKKTQQKIDRRTMLKSAAAATATAAASVGSAYGSGCAGRETGPGALVQLRSRQKTSGNPIKTQAAMDYRTSLAQYGGRLSSPIRELFNTAQKKDCVHFGVLVIGSGYGASVAAARLSQRLNPNYRIAVLERGKEWVPGTFPDTFAGLTNEARAMLAGPTRGQVNQPLGLFNLMMNDEVNIMGGNGLGGGSLINASVALRPHADVFQQARWPSALRNADVLSPYYDRVARAMSLTRTPVDQVPKIRARRLAAQRISSDPDFFGLPNISVMYDYRHLDDQLRNPQGMIQRPCTLCGDCINGCNVGAKNILTMNYLPMARHNGAEMFTQVEVNSIEKMQGYYRVHMTYIDDSENKITRHPVSVNSNVVVVGAGSPGSASILLDSQTDNFQFSPKLGHHWSGNGDTLGFVTGMPPGSNIGGFSTYPTNKPPVGPTVQASVNFYHNQELKKRLLVQDAALPRGVGNLFSTLLRDVDLNNSMVMLGMGHDEAKGRLVKRDGRWQIKWEGLKDSAYRKMVFREFERLAAAHGGRYKRLKAFGDNLVTVHPLGGCGMSDSPDCGTVNHLGQVYDGTGGGYQACQSGEAAVHQGLYVADASVIPTALGVNPYMTIGALAERTAWHIVNNPNHGGMFKG